MLNNYFFNEWLNKWIQCFQSHFDMFTITSNFALFKTKSFLSQHVSFSGLTSNRVPRITGIIKWVLLTEKIAKWGQIWFGELLDSPFHQKPLFWGFPGGAMVENLPANAGDTGSCPGLGRSHTPRSNWAREPQLLSLRLWSLCSATREAAIMRGPRTAMKSGPRLPQLERKPSHRNEDPTQPKISK